MHTDYIGREERCRYIARKMIYWVAAFTVSGVAVDASGLMDVVRARAMTAPFATRTAIVVAKPETKVQARFEQKLEAAIEALADTLGDAKPDTKAAPAEIHTSAAASVVVEAAAAPVQPDANIRRMPVLVDEPSAERTSVFTVASVPSVTIVQPPAAGKLASADPHFEAALTALAMQEPAAAAVASAPVVPVVPAVEEEIPTVPFKGRKALQSTPPTVAPPQVLPASTPTTPPSVAPQETPAVQLPKLADVPLPRPRPPLTPAQELDLHGKERAKAENCLARAIYFEARNEPIRGQIAVAQVVLNRVFSPYYPDTICGVVYQNAHRHLSCQFTFACDGIPDIVREKGPWVRAQRIAKQALDAQVWLTDVAKSTHYHATYVRPNWIREMKKMVKHGQHIFYRPHRWGDGRDEAGWGVASLSHTVKPRLARN